MLFPDPGPPKHRVVCSIKVRVLARKNRFNEIGRLQVCMIIARARDIAFASNGQVDEYIANRGGWKRCAKKWEPLAVFS